MNMCICLEKSRKIREIFEHIPVVGVGADVGAATGSGTAAAAAFGVLTGLAETSASVSIVKREAPTSTVYE